MLGEVLGGINCVKVGVLTPYYYTVGKDNFHLHPSQKVVGIVLQFGIHFTDYECILDPNQQALPYSTLSELQINKDGKVHWDSGSEKERTGLPLGAQRYVHVGIGMLGWVNKNIINYIPITAYLIIWVLLMPLP